MLYRQGDVLIEQVASIPKGARRVEVKGRIVLAEGEATGHAHTIAEQYGELYEKDGTLYLRLSERDAPLTHQEHSTIVLPARKAYRVVRQREWTDADEPRQVLD